MTRNAPGPEKIKSGIKWVLGPVPPTFCGHRSRTRRREAETGIGIALVLDCRRLVLALKPGAIRGAGSAFGRWSDAEVFLPGQGPKCAGKRRYFGLKTTPEPPENLLKADAAHINLSADDEEKIRVD